MSQITKINNSKIFPVVYREFIGERDTSTRILKIEALQELLAHIDDLVNHFHNRYEANYWICISNPLISGLTISMLSALNPVIGAVISAASAIVSVSAIAGASRNIPILKKAGTELKKYAIGIREVSVKDLALLWECAGDEIFLSALMECQHGVPMGVKLVRQDRLSTRVAMIKRIYPSLGMNETTFGELLASFKDVAVSQTRHAPVVVQEAPKPLFADFGTNEEILVDATSFRPQITESRPNNSPDFNELRRLPLQQRAIAVIELLNKSGFDIAGCTESQTTVIAGNQRGGKGTLLAILAILQKALNPASKVVYFSAGQDIYPFKCDRLECALTYPYAEEPDKKVASELYKFLKEMAKATPGTLSNQILVIDEAIALSEHLADEQKEFIAKFLLTRSEKLGGQTFVVLHATNLTAWIGAKATNGIARTFKTGCQFIGCNTKKVKVSPLKTISVASGKYFKADPDSWGNPMGDGDLGQIPEWLKREKNPINGMPDPARTLLSIFPELMDSPIPNPCVDTVKNDSANRRAIAPELHQPEDERTRIERMFNMPSFIPESDCIHPLSDKIIEIIEESSDGRLSLEAIRKSRYWERLWGMKNPLIGEVRECILLLKDRGVISGDDNSGYKLRNAEHRVDDA